MFGAGGGAQRGGGPASMVGYALARSLSSSSNRNSYSSDSSGGNDSDARRSVDKATILSRLSVLHEYSGALRACGGRCVYCSLG